MSRVSAHDDLYTPAGNVLSRNHARALEAVYKVQPRFLLESASTFAATAEDKGRRSHGRTSASSSRGPGNAVEQQPERALQVPVLTGTEGAEWWSKSRGLQPPEYHAVTGPRREMKSLFPVRTRASRPLDIPRQTRVTKRASKTRTRAHRLVASLVVLVVFLMSYCVGRQFSGRSGRHLPRFSTGSSIANPVHGDKATAAAVPSRRLADGERPAWQQEDPADRCSATLRALAADIEQEADEEDGQQDHLQTTLRPLHEMDLPMGETPFETAEEMSSDSSDGSKHTGESRSPCTRSGWRQGGKAESSLSLSPGFAEMRSLTSEILASVPPPVYGGSNKNWTKTQQSYSARYFRVHCRRVMRALQDRMARLQTAAEGFLLSKENEEPAKDIMLKAAGGLLAACVSSHLMLVRMALLFQWQTPGNPFRKALLVDGARTLAVELVKAWELLGVAGEARKEMLKQFVTLVGKQTSVARREIRARTYKGWDQAQEGAHVKRRHVVALKETKALTSAALRFPVVDSLKTWISQGAVPVDGICLDGVLADALRAAGARLESAAAAETPYLASLLSGWRRRQAGRTSVSSGRAAETRRHSTPLPSGWLDKDLAREMTLLLSGAQPSATVEQHDPTVGDFAAGVRLLAEFYFDYFELTPEVLESQRVTVQRLLLSHPDPDSFARAALFRERNSGYLSLLEADVLKVLMKRLVFTLHGLTNAVIDATAARQEQAQGQIWNDVLSALGELDAVLSALSTASERATLAKLSGGHAIS